jgi:pyridoxamine 5'-phosphate oxidase
MLHKPQRRDKELEFYNSLEGSLDHAKALLSRAVKDRKSGFHTLQVATIGLDGSPQIRTVVLRGYDPVQSIIRFHTDARSSKPKEIEANPNVSLHFYDPKQKLQLRIQGIAKLHRDDDLKEIAWEKTRNFSRACYRIEPGPGEIISTPIDAPPANVDNPDEGKNAFMPVTVHFHTLEWLYLAAAGHRRAVFKTTKSGWDMHWLVP